MQPPIAKPAAGFTLLEMLIVLALLGLLTVVLVGMISLGINARARITTVADDHEDLASFRRILVQELGRAYPDWIKAGDRQMIDFDGGADHVAFLAPALQTMGPGLAHYRLLLAQDHGRNEILLQASLAVDQPPDGLSTDFAPGLAEIKFRYFGSPRDGGAGLWQDDWTMRTTPPDLVAISVTFPKGDRRAWPLLVIHPGIDADISCEIDVGTHRCVGR